MALRIRLPQLPRFSSQSILFIGPLLFLIGIATALIAEAAALNGVTDAHRVLSFGTSTMAAGLLVWGCHGLRRSGARRRFLLMVAVGAGYFVLHLHYRYSDYRWLELTRVMTSLDIPLHQEFAPRILSILAVLCGSLLVGLLPRIPLRPAEERRPWHLPLHHAAPVLKKIPLPRRFPLPAKLQRPAFLRRRD